MDVSVRPIGPSDYRIVHALQCEYLDAESRDDFVRRAEANPGLYWAAFHDGDLAGICYGHPSRKDASAVTLQGIAVNLDKTKHYAGTGIGSRLLGAFESAVRRKGYGKISLGCADDPNVERFYLKNGYTPVELLAIGPNGEACGRVGIAGDYEAGKAMQQEIRERYGAREVIFIFEKAIGRRAT